MTPTPGEAPQAPWAKMALPKDRTAADLPRRLGELIRPFGVGNEIEHLFWKWSMGLTLFFGLRVWVLYEGSR